LIPDGLDVTVPLPVPALDTVSVWEPPDPLNVAVTLWAEPMVRTQEPVPQQSPAQPVNVVPPPALAVRVTVVFE
jgi:hypothetical protein